MAAQAGKNFQLSRVIAVSPVTYQAFANCRATDMTLNDEVIDITTKAANGWRIGLEGASIKSMSVSMEGVYTDSTQEVALQQALLNSAFETYRIMSGAGDSYVGDFQVTSYSRSGAQSGEETFSATLESVGAMTYVPSA